ncbi:MAG: Phytoene synthase [Planctomycetota bacterium]
MSLPAPAHRSMPPGALLSPQAVAAASGSSFLVSFRFLDEVRREGMVAIYAYCRVVDDAADDAPDADTAREHLDFWRAELDAALLDGTLPRTEVGRAIARVVSLHRVEPRHLREILEGVGADLDAPRHETEQSLDRYCYLVASAVGLACLPVLGARGPVAEEYAVSLGKALQWTNILRDLHADARDGRVYVPRAWLRELGIEESWLRGQGPEAAYEAGGPLHELVRRIVAVAQRHFAAARAALLRLDRSERRHLLPPRIMGAVYGELLQKLVRRGGDIRGARLRIGRWRKLWIALRVAGSGR